MSGLEPVAIAGAKAVAKAVEEDPTEKTLLAKIAAESGELDPAARALAKRSTVKQHVRLKLMQPLGMLFGVPREYFATNFENEMADRLADVPDEDLIAPKLSVAGPTVQGIAFTVEEPDLKAMYLNLLATASDKRVEASAHPAFAEVIRQLTSEEARLLAGALDAVHRAIVVIRRRITTTEDPTAQGHIVIANHVVNMTSGNTPTWSAETAVYIDNWIRLGLVDVDYGSFLTAPGSYDWVSKNPRYLTAQAEFDTEELQVVEFGQGILSPTDFGRLFHRVVMGQSDA